MGSEARAFLTVWMMASVPPLTPTPSWCGERSLAARRWMRVAQHLATRRRRMLPTAMGRMPPDFLAAACSRAPHRKGATSGDTEPPTSLLTREVSDCRALSLRPGAACSTASRCSGRQPDGPGAEPFLNPLAAFSTSSMLNCTCGVSVVGAGAGAPAAAGCLSCRAALVAAVSGAMPAEVRAWQARAYCPSWTSVRALSAFISSWVFSFCWLFLGLPLLGLTLDSSTASSHSSTASPALHLRSLSLTTLPLTTPRGRPIG